MHSADAAALKIHVAPSGEVWYVQGDALPENSGLTVTEFLQSTRCQDADFVRAIGVADNAALIVGIHEQRLNDRTFIMEVCSPLACTTAAERRDPKMSLFRARQFGHGLSPSRGGWHAFTELDYPSYLLAARIRDQHADEEYIQHVVRAHPAWPAISFVYGLNRAALGNLVAVVLDPRWYIDLEDPDRMAKLESYLGLVVPCQRAVWAREPPTRQYQLVRYRRCQLVNQCWASSLSEICDRTDPRMFVQRVWLFHLSRGPVRALLRASRFFVKYLRSVWLDALNAKSPHQHQLFVPEYFFRNPHEIKAFREHMESF